MWRMFIFGFVLSNHIFLHLPLFSFLFHIKESIVFGNINLIHSCNEWKHLKICTMYISCIRISTQSEFLEMSIKSLSYKFSIVPAIFSPPYKISSKRSLFIGQRFLNRKSLQSRIKMKIAKNGVWLLYPRSPVTRRRCMV